MERSQNYKCIIATYGIDNLCLPYVEEKIVKAVYNEVDYSISIAQDNTRTITISSAKPVYWSKLFWILSPVERLLMIFEGAFLPLQKINYAEPEDPEVNIGIVNEQAKNDRLSYFISDNISTIKKDKLVDYQDVLTDKLFDVWMHLLDELDIVNQIYLYCLSKSGMPVDLRLSFMVEMAEAMVEIVNEKGGSLSSYDPEAKKDTLKGSIRALIGAYGKEIFEKEIHSGSYDDFLKTLKSSRVRIMHIKRKQPEEDYFDGDHSKGYMMKLSLLYRRILLDLMDIPSDLYENKLLADAEGIDRWMNQFDKKP